MNRFSKRQYNEAQIPSRRSYEIVATSEASRLLLEATQDLNEQIYMVRELRHQRSENLSLSEKSWIDNAIANTSKAVSGISNFTEPLPESQSFGRRWLPDSSILQRLSFRIKDSPQASAQLVRLSVAAQLLSSAMSILSSHKNDANTNLEPSPEVVPDNHNTSHNDLSEFIHQRRSYRSSSTPTDFQLPLTLASSPVSPHSSNATPSSNTAPSEGGRSADDKFFEIGPTFSRSPANSEASRTYQSKTASEDVVGNPWSRTLTQRRFEAGLTGQRESDLGLTLVIETMEDWRQTTERALSDINALGLALSSGLIDRSISTRLCRTRTQRQSAPQGRTSAQSQNIAHSQNIAAGQIVSQSQSIRRKPVPGRASSINNLSAPSMAGFNNSIQNSFDKESLPDRFHLHPIPRASSTQDFPSPPTPSTSEKEPLLYGLDPAPIPSTTHSPDFVTPPTPSTFEKEPLFYGLHPAPIPRTTQSSDFPKPPTISSFEKPTLLHSLDTVPMPRTLQILNYPSPITLSSFGKEKETVHPIPALYTEPQIHTSTSHEPLTPRNSSTLSAFHFSPSTSSLHHLKSPSINESMTSISTISSVPYRISRGRAWLEHKAGSFEEEPEDTSSCMPER